MARISMVWIVTIHSIGLMDASRLPRILLFQSPEANQGLPLQTLTQET